MEIKRPSEITEADIPNIEHPHHASLRIRRIFQGFTHLIRFDTNLLDKIVEGQMQIYLGSNGLKHEAYWRYYKSGGREIDRDYKFRSNDPVRTAVLKDFKWGKYLIVLNTETDYRPLFERNKNNTSEPHNKWKQTGDASPFYDYMGFEDILSRHNSNHQSLGYPLFFGSGKTQSITKDNVLIPEPWPEESTGNQESFVAPVAQPPPQLVPTAPETDQPRGPASNDSEFDVKKGFSLLRLLRGGGIAAILLETLFPSIDVSKEWKEEGVSYNYNPDDFTFEITHPDGTKEDLLLYPNGTVTDRNGAIVGSVEKNGGFEPVTEQEELDYRVWKANGGGGSFAVWRNSGKPLETTSIPDGAKSKAIEIDIRDGGHSVARHGADVTDEELKKRLETGIAPDGKFSPTPASTRFKSHEEWLKTRADAIKTIEKREGVDLSKPPKSGEKTKYDINIDHERAIDDGFVGDKSTKIKITDPISGKKGPVYLDSKPVSGITRTQTLVKWNPESSSWEVKQHFPDARNWNQSTQSY